MSFEAVIDAAAAAEGVPAPLLRAVGIVESGLNPATGASHAAPAVGGQRGQGMMQLTPSTARAMGVDPDDPAAAVRGAARYLRQGYDATGSWDDAARYYHGGPDRRQWGPRTEAYRGKVSAAIATATPPNSGVTAGDPPLSPDDHDNAFTRGLRGQDTAVAPPADSPETDPSSGDNFFSRGLAAATNGAYGRNASNPAGLGDGVAGQPQGGNGGLGGVGAALRGDGVRGGGGMEGVRSAPALVDVAHGVSDFGAGLATGAIATPAATLANGAAWLAGKAGATDLQQRWTGEAQDLMNRGHALAFDPNGAAYKFGDIGGEIAATLPLVR